MKTITVEELQEQLDSIMDDYGKGDDTHYKVVWTDKGVEKAVMLIPHDGPYEETVKQDEEGNLYVELPERLLAKQGWGEGTELNMEVVDGSIILTENKSGE
jgi:hypothetical protein